jgi:hypothetical protein
MIDPTHKYGFITPHDVKFFEPILGLVAREFNAINMLEIGVNEAGTTHGVYEHSQKLGVPFRWTGIDRDPARMRPTLPPNSTFIVGESTEAFIKVVGEFNLLFVDGNHDRNHAMLDFLNYSDFVVPGGYCVYHDTGDEIQGIMHQGTGPDHPAFCFATRDAFRLLGLLPNVRSDWTFFGEQKGNAGMCAFRRKH